MTDEDIKRGYPTDKEEMVLFQLALALIFLLLVVFFAGQFLRDLGVYAVRLITIK